MRHRYSCLLALTFGFTLTSAQGDTFVDKARVVSIEPVVETTREPITRHHCESPDSALSGELYEDEGSGQDLLASIEAERKLRETLRRARRCYTVEEWERRERVVGYRVRYQYQGQTLVRQMPYDPGEWMRVVVDLEPTP